MAVNACSWLARHEQQRHSPETQLLLRSGTKENARRRAALPDRGQVDADSGGAGFPEANGW